jgi:hypothetical protein
MNKWAHADSSVGACGGGWRAPTQRGGGDWHDDSSDRSTPEPAVPWRHESGRHEPADRHDDRDTHHHGPAVTDAGTDAGTDLGGLAVLIGGFAAAAGETSLATGMVQSAAQDRGDVSIAWGEAVFDANGHAGQPGEAFAAADTWLQVTGADLLLRWDIEASDRNADQAWAHSEIDYMAIDIHAWSPTQPIVIDVEHTFTPQSLHPDAGLLSHGPDSYAAVASAVEARGVDALALTSTYAFTESQFSFVHAMALASL